MKKYILFLVMGLMVHLSVFAQDYAFRKETHSFARRGGQTLYLDRYTSLNPSQTDAPCLLFVFGGAFARGARDVEKYMPYFEYFVQNGFTVVSIDYRLGLKDISQNPNASLPEFYEAFMNAVDMAVEDLFDATRYVLDRAGEWRIDPALIITNGSSAGAVTVLQAEYILCNGLPRSQMLPRGFRYAGVISFAGAIFTEEPSLRWGMSPAPLLLMHGDADLQVPYDILSYEGAGFYGANAVADSVENLPSPFKFVSFTDHGHEIASDPMRDKKEEVLNFVREMVIEGQPLQVRSVERRIGKPAVEKDFDITDYIKGNFDR